MQMVNIWEILLVTKTNCRRIKGFKIINIKIAFLNQETEQNIKQICGNDTFLRLEKLVEIIKKRVWHIWSCKLIYKIKIICLKYE